MTNLFTYEIIGTQELTTKMGKIKCYVIQAEAQSKLGKTHLTSFFNKEYGFVKLEYENSNRSSLTLELINRYVEEFCLRK